MTQQIGTTNQVTKISEICNEFLGMDANIKDFIQITENIFDLNEENLEEVYEKIIDYNKSYMFFTKCIEHALKIRPKNTKLFCSLLAKLKKEKGYNPNNFLNDEQINILKKENIIPEYTCESYIPDRTEIEKIIKEDNIDALIKLSSEQSFNPTQKIEFTNRNIEYYVQEVSFSKVFGFKASLMQLMAYWGSIKCFKYALLDGSFDETNLAIFAVAGGNNEIIHLLEQRDVDFGDSFIVSVCFHRNNISDWIINNYKYTPIKLKDTINSYNIGAFFFNIKYFIDISQKSIDKTLFCAVDTNNVEITKYLIKNLNANKEKCNKYELSLTDIAVDNENVEMLKCLVEDFGLGSDISFDEHFSQNLEMVKYYCEVLKKTDYIYFSGNENLDVLKYLVDNNYVGLYDYSNISQNIKDYIKSKKILNEYVYMGDVSEVKRLIEKENYKVDLMINDETPLSIAIETENMELVKYFVDNHLEHIRHIDKALQKAFKKRFDIFKYIIDKCKEKSIDIERSIFINKYFSGFSDIEHIKYLLENCYISKKNIKKIMDGSCYKGNLYVAKYLIEHNNKKDITDEETFSIACRSSNIELVKYLVKELNIDKSYFYNSNDLISILSIKSYGGNFENIKYLVKTFNIDKTYFHSNEDLFKVLRSAVLNGNIEQLEYMDELFNVSKLTLEMEDISALFDAGCQKDSLDNIKYIVSKFNVNIFNLCLHNHSPLVYAAKWGSFSILKYLIEELHAFYWWPSEYKEVPNYPLNFAIGNIEMFNYLTKYFEIFYMDSYFYFGHLDYFNNEQGLTEDYMDYLISINKSFLYYISIYCALKRQFNNVIYLVEKYHVNIEKDGEDNIDFLKYIKEKDMLNEACKKGDLELVKKLIEEKKYYHNQVINKDYPLKIAVLKGDMEIIRYLIEEKKAYIYNDLFEIPNEMEHYEEMKYIRKKCSLFIACRNNDLDRVKEIVEQGEVNVDQVLVQIPDDYYHKTAIYYAIKNGNLEMVKYLIEEAHANLYATSIEYLSVAFKSFNLDLVKYLVEEHNLPVSDKCHYRQPPLLIALRLRWRELIVYLDEKFGININTEYYKGTPLTLLIQILNKT